MAACEKCGEKAGIGKKLCGSCTAKMESERRRREREAEEKQALERQARQEQEAAQRQVRYEAYIESRFAELDDLVSQGVSPYLYDIITISTQSSINGNRVGQAPDLTELRKYGWAGWEISGVIPSTYGEGLKNVSYGVTTDETWGAGVGGLVVGAYVILRFKITGGVLQQRRQYVESLLANDFPG